MPQQITIKEIVSKSILQKSGLPDADWVINPYAGCRFGCKYCYAAFVGKFRHPNEEWGSYVDVKINAPELLQKELTKKLKDTKDIGSIFFSSVTDPYQGLEAKYKLTQKCLQVLLDFDYQGKVSILTKSTLVTRDINLFKQFHDIEVGLTITSTGDPISKYLETYATPHESRLAVLAELFKAGISTYAFVGPLLPHFVWQAGKVKELLQAVKNAGVKYIYVEHLNLTPTIKKRLFEFLKKDHPELLEKFTESTKLEYRDKLDKIIHSLLQELELPLAHEEVIYHQNCRMSKNWFVYVVECKDHTYYTGVSNNLHHRIEQHNLSKGAKYTRDRGPVSLVYSEKCENHSAALKKECEIKKLTRSQKKKLIK